MATAGQDDGDLVRRVLHVLADLSPTGEAKAASLAIPTEWFAWQPLTAVRLFHRSVTEVQFAQPVDRNLAEQWDAVDRIRPEERNLRLGWLFVAGRTPDETGRVRRVFRPLVTVPVRVQRSGFSAHLAAAGDTELTPLIDDRDTARRLEAAMEFGGGALDDIEDIGVPPALLERLTHLREFATAAAKAAGFDALRIVAAKDGPEKLLRSDGLRIVAGAGVYVARDTGTSGRAGSLRAWAQGPLRRPTAFSTVYGLTAGEGTVATSVADDERVDSPFVLTPAQRRAVVRSRHDPVTVISGAPGTGKSHTVTAIACDALARGERVLVAAKSDATVDALLDLLERAPGPDPVVFGSHERRDALARRLAAGQAGTVPEASVEAARRHAVDAAAARDALRRDIVRSLRAEQSVERPEATEDASRCLAPRLFEPSADLLVAERLVEEASAPASGLLGGWRQRRARRHLTRWSGATEADDLAGLREAVTDAIVARRREALLAEGGLELEGAWRQLAALEDLAREHCARWLAADTRSARRLNRATLGAVAALATGLRSGRAARREQLQRLDDERLTFVLPLWIGSLPDIDDLLPPIAGLFDLVILDEASSIDQPTAATALLRGQRAVVVGDPRQLRHVSFLGDDALRTTLAAHGIADPVLSAQLDVRRNSAFDLAAGAAPVEVLDEHFRADPHLVSFVFDRLYDDDVRVATRSPSQEAHDAIDVHLLRGERDRAGVVTAEVQRVVREVKSLRRDGVRSVGVVTPFRAQADAIEAALLAELDADAIEALDLRVGTVHAFQGNERDVVIVSLGVGSGAPPASWRFVEDRHLFAVLATRARRRLVLLMSGEPPATGLLADYVAQADAPPPAVAHHADLPPWPEEVAAGLEEAGVDVRRSYVTGRHLVDVAALDHVRRSVAVECRVHPDGPDAHVDRHLALVRAGWRTLDAYRSRWAARPGELLVELAGELGVSRR